VRVFDPARLRARLLWGGIAAVLALGIPLSFVMIGGATSSAESEARDRATRWATQTLPETLGNQIISKPIVDEDFRDVKAVVDSEILSDDRVLRVRIWNDAGLLVFSSFQRDKVGETVATGDDQVRPRSSERQSTTSPWRMPPVAGLKRSAAATDSAGATP